MLYKSNCGEARSAVRRLTQPLLSCGSCSCDRTAVITREETIRMQTRTLAANDKAAWQQLFKGYNDFYQANVPP